MKRHILKAAAFLFVSLAVLLLLAPNPATSQSPVASFFYDERGNVVRQERDTNGDGKMDRWTYYDRQGQIERVEQDINFDGKPDLFVYYEAGKPKRQEIASKNDGHIDIWYFLDSNGEVEQRPGSQWVRKADDLGLLSKRPASAERGGSEILRQCHTHCSI